MELYLHPPYTSSWYGAWALGQLYLCLFYFVYLLFFMPVFVNSAACSRSVIAVHIKMNFITETENDFLQELCFQFDLFLILPA